MRQVKIVTRISMSVVAGTRAVPGLTEDEVVMSEEKFYDGT